MFSVLALRSIAVAYLSFFNNTKLLYQRVKTENSKSLVLNAHSHVTYEVLYIIKGDVSLVSEGIRYRLLKNDLILIPSKNFHRVVFESDCEYERCNLALTSAIAKITKFQLANTTKGTILFRFQNNNEIANAFQKLDYYSKALSEEAFFDVAQSILKELFYFLSLNQQYIKKPEETHYSPLLVSILNYINENLFKIKHVTDISSSLYISYSYLIKIFKKQFNSSPKKYIMEKRLLAAHKMIAKGEKPSTVYEIVGFESYNVFYRSYCAYFGFMPSKQESSNSIENASTHLL